MKRAFILAILVAALTLTGCGGAPKASAEATVPPEDVPADTPSAAPTAEPTPEPTPTPTPEPTPTPTPRPLSPEEELFREAERMYFVELKYGEVFYKLRAAQYDGYGPTLTLLGRCRYFGTGTKVNYREAYQYFSQAADLGDPLGLYWKAMCHYHATGVWMPSSEAAKAAGEELFPAALEAMTAAAEECDDPLLLGELLFRIGMCHYDGLGTEKDPETAGEYLDRAIELGNTDACYQRSLYGFNTNSPKTIDQPEKVVDLLEQAAAGGNDKALMRLGLAYAGRMGALSQYVGEDMERARALLQQIVDHDTYMAPEARIQLENLN